MSKTTLVLSFCNYVGGGTSGEVNHCYQPKTVFNSTQECHERAHMFRQDGELLKDYINMSPIHGLVMVNPPKCVQQPHVLESAALYGIWLWVIVAIALIIRKRIKMRKQSANV